MNSVVLFPSSVTDQQFSGMLVINSIQFFFSPNQELVIDKILMGNVVYSGCLIKCDKIQLIQIYICHFNICLLYACVYTYYKSGKI